MKVSVIFENVRCVGMAMAFDATSFAGLNATDNVRTNGSISATMAKVSPMLERIRAGETRDRDPVPPRFFDE